MPNDLILGARAGSGNEKAGKPRGNGLLASLVRGIGGKSKLFERLELLKRLKPLKRSELTYVMKTWT